MAVKRKQDAIVQLKIRMREPMRAALEKEAARRGVSLNSEMVNRIQRTLDSQSLLEEVIGLLAPIDVETTLRSKIDGASFR